MNDQNKTVGNEETAKYFDPKIPGLQALLNPPHPHKNPEDGFRYYGGEPFNIVLYGPSGAGKTTIALQMAFAAVRKNKQVIYLTKDTSSKVLFERIVDTFRCFEKGYTVQCVALENELFNRKGWAKTVKIQKSNPGPLETIDFLFLNKEAEVYILDILEYDAQSSKKQRDKKTHLTKLLTSPVFIFADFDETPSSIGKLNRFSVSYTVYDALACLVPNLKPLFDKMKELDDARRNALKEQPDHLDLFVVCDALSVPALDENLRIQTSQRKLSEIDGNQSAKYIAPRKPLSLYVMESEVMPSNMTVAFPPDVQICLGTRQEAHEVFSPTIRLVKTRFQYSLSDRATYKIRDAKYLESKAEKTLTGTEYDMPTPGVEVFAPLSHENFNITNRKHDGSIRFGIKGFDNLTDNPGFDRGGCTLLVTDNRCGATPLSLYYLMGQIAEEKKGEPVLSSVLYISFSDEVADVRLCMKRYSMLRRLITNERNGLIEESDFQYHGNNVQRIKLNRPNLEHSYLNVFLPKFQWLTPEQALSQVVALLTENELKCAQCKIQSVKHGCKNCLRIDRLVLDRVSRLQACWPLVKDAGIFISALVALCKAHSIEIMLIDDTATKEENTALFHSRWASMAQNVIRLRRVPFHGSEATTIEISSAGGNRSVQQKRPYELISQNQAEDLDVLDTFRGHTFLPSGEPVRCKVKVELCYDAKITPLHHEVATMKQSIEAAMDGVEVKVRGRGEWTGINSAFSNLTNGSRDICHVVAVDGIGLQHLLFSEHNRQVLHSFTADELTAFLPGHIIKKSEAQHINSLAQESAKLEMIRNAFHARYITRSSSIALANLDKDTDDLSYFAAIPMRHNWGVLAATKLSDVFMNRVLSDIFANTKDSNWTSDWSLIWDKLNDATTGLYAKARESQLNWDEIADFRVNYWYAFWKNKQTEGTIAKHSDGKGTDPWLLLFPRIDLFGLALTSEESVVSFFLELCLAYHSSSELFTIVEKRTVAQLTFNINDNDVEGFRNILYRFYRLLSPRQRRQLSIGAGAAHRDIGSGLIEQIYGGGDDNPFSEWPKQICLFSREWITTVQDLMPRYDVRKSIEMYPLPSGYVPKAKEQTPLEKWWNKFDLNRDEAEGNYAQTWSDVVKMGIPVAGTWYLGVLNGGNIDLAPDVMKPILSTEHEHDRFLSRSGAPVSREVYGIHGKPHDGGAKRTNRLPYADVMRRIKKPTADKERIFFPFHRSQIQRYSEISPILYDLIRNVMSLQCENEALLEKECLGEIRNEIDRQVMRSFRRISIILENLRDSK